MLHTVTAGITDLSSVLEEIIKSQVDGVVVYNDKIENDQLELLSRYNIPIVLIGNKAKGEKISSVFVDVKKAIFEITTKYLEEGKDKIAILQDRKNFFLDEGQ